jgi:flagellar capping protein FliD
VNDTKNYIIYTFYASSGASTGTVCFILDYRTGFAWCRDSYADAFNCGAIFENNSGEFVPYFGSYTGQVVVTGSGQSDNGVAISSYARTGDLFINKVAIRSKWLYNELRGSVGSDTQSVIVDYYVDGDDTLSSSSTIILYRENQPTWDTVNWEEFNWAYSGLTTKSNEINMEAKTLGIKVSNSILGNTATIEGMSIFAIPEGWKQES